MDPDELSTPGYAVLSPGDENQACDIGKGTLNDRHPHFTQPIFVRFPAIQGDAGRRGLGRYPQSSEISLEAAILRRSGPSIRRLH